MGVMGIPMRAGLAMALVLLCGSVVVAFDGYNGLPRPSGMDQAPTTTYGPKPAVTYENKAAKCIWYGWENGNYPPAGTHNCSTSLWASLSAANPAGLSGYMYYVPLEDIYFDPLYNEYLCAIGCFDLTAASGPAAGPVLPPTESPPADSPVVLPPVPVAAPPVVAAPPPVKATSPPSPGALVPPPATLFRPPPPATPLPPSPTPTMIIVPPSESAPSPAISPEISPETSPVLSPGSSPIYSPGSGPVSSPGTGPGTGPGPTTGGPSNIVQGSSATTISVPTVLVFTAALFLCINFLV